MKNFEHLLTVWQGQPVKEQLSVDEVLKQVKKGVSSISNKLRREIAVVSVAIAVIGSLAVFGSFHNTISSVGLLLLVAGMAIYLTLQIADYRTLAKHDPTQNPVAYLQNLKAYQKHRAYVNGRFFYTYSLIVAAAIALYTIEVLEGQSLWLRLGFYVFCAAYLIFCTFYLKNIIIKNENEKVNLMIERLERIKGQFEEA